MSVRVSRRSVVSAGVASVLLPYTKPELFSLGAPAALALSGPPVGSATMTPVPTTGPCVINQIEVVIYVNAIYGGGQRVVDTAARSAIASLGGQIRQQGGGSEHLVYYVVVTGPLPDAITAYTKAINSALFAASITHAFLEDINPRPEPC